MIACSLTLLVVCCCDTGVFFLDDGALLLERPERLDVQLWLVVDLVGVAAQALYATWVLSLDSHQVVLSVVFLF